MKKLIPLLLILSFIDPLLAQDETMLKSNIADKAEEEIWSLEEIYISYFREANHEAILSLWHPQILAWPDSEPYPAGKEMGAKFLEEKFPNPNKINFKIERAGIRVLGNVAITHYLLISSWIDEGGIVQKSESRITHTWLKEDSKWSILGGMSNNK